jgi:methylphosphotriester-DNA--protein-cysteine methyltransferase
MMDLPEARSDSFWLNSSTWQFPEYENADIFVDRLVRNELLAREPVVDTALQSDPPVLSVRSVQRRFLRATGLTRGTLSQIDRARYATSLLQQGVSILETVDRAGYADQPHLTRSLKYFIGQTPAQLFRKSDSDQLSFLSRLRQSSEF